MGYGAISSIRGEGLSFPLAEASRAQEVLGKGGVIGKLVLVSGAASSG